MCVHTHSTSQLTHLHFSPTAHDYIALLLLVLFLHLSSFLLCCNVKNKSAESTYYRVP